MQQKVYDAIGRWYKKGSWSHWYAVLRTKLFQNRFSEILAFVPNTGRLIDVGCGYGLTANLFSVERPNLDIVGLDTNKLRISKAQQTIGERKRITFLVGDALSFSYKEGDTIFLIDVLHHIPKENHEPFLKQIKEALGANGKLLIADVHKTKSLRYAIAYLVDILLYPFSMRCQFRSPEEMKRLFARTGWKLEGAHLTVRKNLFPTILYVCT